MDDGKVFSIDTLRLRHERHVVHARQRARDIANALGFDRQDQVRLATAASELARNAFRYASGGAIQFLVRDSEPQFFILSVTDEGPGIPNLEEILDGHYASKTGLGNGIVGTKRLMEHFKITSSVKGTRVEAAKRLPADTKRIDEVRAVQIARELAPGHEADPFEEMERQNQELLRTLAELREKQEILTLLNRELEDTNRGVVALYAELDQRAIDLRRVSDMKTSFLSNLSHEFRTPLNSITSLARMLLSYTDGRLEPEQEKQITFIKQSASELSELVNDLLDLAKVEAGKIDVKAKSFEVHELFGALRGMLKPLLVGNSVELNFEADPAIAPLYTDEGKLSQILRNLVSNALKFTTSGHVRVTAQVGPELPGNNDTEMSTDGVSVDPHTPVRSVLFSVEDTGIGINAQDQQRIFDEFVQVEGPLQAQAVGTGLGLPLSRRLSELLGGTLTVESEVGVGSTFTLVLPMRVDEMSAASSSEYSLTSSQGPIVLFVEDNRETTFVFESALKGTPYHLVFAPSLNDARTAIRRVSPALVVLDRIVDRQDCLFFVDEMRSMPYGGPVLLLSASDGHKAALDAGATLSLTKPVPPFTLVNTIRELIEGESSRKILLSDDDEVTRYLLGDALAGLGYRILEARNGREAIRMAQEHRPDLIFLDIVMPDLNGFEVLREMRLNSETRQTSIIVHSSKTFTEQELALLTAEKVLVYPKQPLGDDESKARLRQVLTEAGLSL